MPNRPLRANPPRRRGVPRLQSQPVFFPLPQVRTMGNWDVVCFGDDKGEAQLMNVFRVAGPDKQLVKAPDVGGNWSLVMSSGANVKIEPSADGFLPSMPPRAAPVWIRK